MNDSPNQSHRIWSLDLLRGLMIALMTFSHTIHFSQAYYHPLLGTLNSIINLLSFTTFLLISGAVGYLSYINPPNTKSNPRWRLAKRLLIYLLGYYFISIWASFILNHGITGQQIINILTFQTLIPFTEFIIPFIIFGLLNIPLKPIYKKIAPSLTITTILGTFLYLIGILLATGPSIKLGTADITAWKAILVSHPHHFSFPILQYFPVYLIGLHLGYLYHLQLINHHKLINLIKISLILTTLSIFNYLIITPDPRNLIQRWPPSIPFLLIGLSTALVLLLAFQKLQDLKNHPWTRTFLLILGQNAFAIFFTYTFLDYLLKSFRLPPLHSPLLVFTLWIFLLSVAVYLAKIIPLNWTFDLTLIKWCQCRLTHCAHAQEHFLIKQIKTIILKIIQIRDLFAINIGGYRLRLIKKRHILIGFIIVLFSATALGIGENYQYTADQVAQLQGQTNRTWILTTEPQPQIIYQIQIPAQLQPNQITTLIKSSSQQEIPTTYKPEPSNSAADIPSTYTTTIPLSEFPPDTYQIQTQLTIFGIDFRTEPTTFYISHPFYITWTIDWEGYNAPDDHLNALSQISQDYGVPMTQMFNPYIYIHEQLPDNQKTLPYPADTTNPAQININNNYQQLLAPLTSERIDYLTNWVIQRHDLFGDEIGLHLHMYPQLVSDARVEPKSDPVWGGGFTPGYDILTTAYSYDDMVKILTRAQGWLASRDLGVPKSFRAGAWFANLDTLRALQDTNFLVDSSGRTPYTFGTNQITGPWKLEPTTQPYYPSLTDQNQPADPTLALKQGQASFARHHALQILEIPNNGADTYAFSAQQMIQRFKNNLPRLTKSEAGLPQLIENETVTFIPPLLNPQQVTYLSHPHWFYPQRQQAIRQVFDYLKQFNYANDTGPVVYTTLLGVYNAFK